MDVYDQHKRDKEFNRELEERYKRLSLLTLDLAEEAGQAAVNFSKVDKGDRAGRFERRISAMSRAIWAHQAIERLRKSRPFKRRLNIVQQRQLENRRVAEGEWPADAFKFMLTGEFDPHQGAPIPGTPTHTNEPTNGSKNGPTPDASTGAAEQNAPADNPYDDDLAAPDASDGAPDFDAITAAIEKAVADEAASVDVLRAAIDADRKDRDWDSERENAPGDDATTAANNPRNRAPP